MTTTPMPRTRNLEITRKIAYARSRGLAWTVPTGSRTAKRAHVAARLTPTPAPVAIIGRTGNRTGDVRRAARELVARRADGRPVEQITVSIVRPGLARVSYTPAGGQHITAGPLDY